MKLACEHPVLIFNPNLRWLFSVKCCRAVLFGRIIEYSEYAKRFNRFPWRDFYTARPLVTEDNQSECYLVDDNGCVYPVFMFVPCGHCRLCRNRKTNEWQTRCMAESATHKFRPLFITLTFKPECRPADMQQCYVDFRNFMKRLRINIQRDLGVKHELRYIACSEWTPKNHYPHIHMILWGMPYISCAEGDSNSFQTLIHYIQDDAWQNGYCKVEFARDCSAAYPLKYMRKGMDPDTWFTASRRRGIGYKFAESLRPTLERCPDMTSFSLPQRKFSKSGVETVKIVQCGFPAYFKRILFPTLSNLFPAKVCKAAKDFVSCASDLQYAFSLLYPNMSWYDNIKYQVKEIQDKYYMMHIDFDDATPDKKFADDVMRYFHLRDSENKLVPQTDDRCKYIHIQTNVVDGVLDVRRIPSLKPIPISNDRLIPSKASTLTADCTELRKGIISRFVEFKCSYAILSKFQFDVDDYLRRLALTEEHAEYVRAMSENLPDVDVAQLVDNYERDMKWIETHWMIHEIG